MDGQMTLFDYIEKSEPKRIFEDQKPHRVAKPNPAGDIDFLGEVDETYALSVKGREMKFSELTDMVGKNVLLRSRYYLHGKAEGERNRYRIVKVMEYHALIEPIVDDSGNDVAMTDRCLVMYSYGFNVPKAWLDEHRFFGGIDARAYGYPKNEWVYELIDGGM
jgi:hypothetical protein